MYLLPNCCHTPACHTTIPISLALRITRICITSIDEEKRDKELKELVLRRDYKPRMIGAAISKARAIHRKSSSEGNGQAPAFKETAGIFFILGPQAPLDLCSNQESLENNAPI